NITTTTGNTNLQTGLVDINGTFTVIPGGSPAGSLVADPVQLSTPVGPVTAITESAGAPSNFDLIAGIVTGAPIITGPVKIPLANNPTPGPSCFIGSEQDPILLNPQTNDLSSALSVGGFFSFDAATGAPDVTGPDGALLITGAVQGDDTFAVPERRAAARTVRSTPWSIRSRACRRRRAATTSCSTTRPRRWRSHRTCRTVRRSPTTGTSRSVHRPDSMWRGCAACAQAAHRSPSGDQLPRRRPRLKRSPAGGGRSRPGGPIGRGGRSPERSMPSRRRSRLARRLVDASSLRLLGIALRQL